MFADQSGFYLLPMAVRTYSPVGKTPVLHERLSRDHLSAMSAITLEGKLYMKEQEKAFKGEDVVRFLKHLMGQIPGKLLIIWDGSPIHRGGAVKEFLASGAASRLQLEQLPGYAPDLNPDDSPRAMAGHPSAWAAVGSGKVVANHSRTAGENRSSAMGSG